LDRQKALQRLEKAWQDFQESYAGLSDSLLIEPGVTKAWSVRDILAHVTTWEEEALKHLPLVLQGGRPPRYSTTYGGIDAFNALTTERKKHLSLRQVLQEQRATHRRLIEYLESVPSAEFTSETRFRHRLRLDTYAHYPKHAQAIRIWRSKL
jgi:hypothetical protein